MRTVPLGGKKAAGRVALVDDEDYDLVAQYRWFVKEDTRPGHRSGPYACTQVPVRGDGGRRQRELPMHVLVAGYAKPDHIDGDGLNNQRSNLRPATPGQNSMNKRKRWRATSRYVGVSLTANGKWAARIGFQGKVRSLGTFASEEEAARAYDAAARELFGEYARLNFPEKVACDGNCLEATDLGGGLIGLRNTHDTASPILRITADEWQAFIAKAKTGAFDALPEAA